MEVFGMLGFILVALEELVLGHSMLVFWVLGFIFTYLIALEELILEQDMVVFFIATALVFALWPVLFFSYVPVKIAKYKNKINKKEK